MFDRNYSKPRYWKALLVTVIFSVPLALFARAVVPMTDIVWFGLTIGLSLVMAWTIHTRMIDDWRARYEMNLTTFEKRNAVGKNVRIDRR
jgi:hypothetical protein